LLIEKGAIDAKGSFLGIGDPVFNRADSRYRGNPEERVPAAAFTLPRLPNTDVEVQACSRAWGSDSRRLLTGAAANIGVVEQALSESPAVIHFATHVVTATGEFGSGIIALGLDPHGAIGLMGPKDIAARQVPGSLVVMNGCHSAQGEAAAASGLMGLTRAWIGAGARAVLSTRWDVPDEAAQTLMVNFYRALSEDPRGNPATALREAQLTALRSSGPDREPSRWAGYFLLSRI
jgi:CHAT domain-containing protein